MLVQAIQASLVEAGEGHDPQPASAGTGTTSKVQPDSGPGLKVQDTPLVRRLAPAVMLHKMSVSSCVPAPARSSSEAARSACACVALTLATCSTAEM